MIRQEAHLSETTRDESKFTSNGYIARVVARHFRIPAPGGVKAVAGDSSDLDGNLASIRSVRQVGNNGERLELLVTSCLKPQRKVVPTSRRVCFR